MLTAVVKLFLKKPDRSQGIVQWVLNTATKDCESPDVRDCAYIYCRLLSMDPAAVKVRSGRLFFADMMWLIYFCDFRLSFFHIDHQS